MILPDFEAFLTDEGKVRNVNWDMLWAFLNVVHDADFKYIFGHDSPEGKRIIAELREFRLSLGSESWRVSVLNDFCVGQAIILVEGFLRYVENATSDLLYLVDRYGATDEE